MTIRIGGGQGFYGDGLGPVPDVLEAGVDYLVCEALAELTLAILQKDRQRDESLGFTRDLPMYVRAALPYVVDGRTRFITNAGGINPVAAGRAVVATLKEAGATGLVVATVGLWLLATVRHAFTAPTAVLHDMDEDVPLGKAA